VLLSAVRRDRLPEQVVRFVATDSNSRWLVTSEIMKEYLEVLQRPKFGLNAEALRHWAELIELRTIVVPTPTSDIQFPRDPKDAPFLAAAISEAADFLITGDRDLNQLKGTLPTRIVTVAEFAAEYHVA
jgi:putative PIN family toxin of toxin-antitoxin system